MKKLSHRVIILGITVVLLAVLISTTSVQATAPYQPSDQPNFETIFTMANLAAAVPALPESTIPPPAEQNPCLHCHIAGEIYWEWSPITRWFVFSTMVLTFIFGISRNVIVWKSRERWHSIWMDKFGTITAIFFIFQIILGISLLILSEFSSESLLQIKKVLNTIHWANGIVFFISAMGLSFAGILRPGYQRPIWAVIFITGISASALAFSHLSFSHLYDWNLPPTPSQLFTYHSLLIPLAIAGALSIFFALRNRGANRGASS